MNETGTVARPDVVPVAVLTPAAIALAVRLRNVGSVKVLD
jgi:hypothetical protein